MHQYNFNAARAQKYKVQSPPPAGVYDEIILLHMATGSTGWTCSTRHSEMYPLRGGVCEFEKVAACGY